MPDLLSVENLDARYGDFQALHGVNLRVAEGEVLLILEAMKMETEIRAAQAGTVRGIAVKAGDAVAVGDTLMTLA